MSSQPIGLFDSGVGGLTVMREVAKLLPHEQLIYFGDTARLPYGNKSPETVRRFAKENAEFLLQQNIKLLVIACHTACCHAFDELAATLPIPVVGVTKPGIEAVLQATKTKQVAVLGTASTIGSGLLQNRLCAADPAIVVHGVACPLFVPFVEEGLHASEAVNWVAHHYLDPLARQSIDAALLACTHYPLLVDVLQRVLGSNVQLILPAQATAVETKRVLTKAGLLSAKQQIPQHRFYASDDPEKFQRTAKLFFPQSIDCVEYFLASNLVT